MSAVFSPCRTWRYTLSRWTVQEEHHFNSVLFVCLNPSTADEVKNDQTVTRCAMSAARWGYDRVVVCNIFAVRSTDPKALKVVPDPVGPENDRYIFEEAAKADFIVCAWGEHGRFMDRGAHVAGELAAWHEIHALGFNKSGTPKHPLYLRSDTRPVKW